MSTIQNFIQALGPSAITAFASAIYVLYSSSSSERGNYFFLPAHEAIIVSNEKESETGECYDARKERGAFQDRPHREGRMNKALRNL